MDRGILERLRDGRGVKSICKELKVGKERVREVRERGIAHRYLAICGKTGGEVVVPLVPLALFPDVLDGRSLRVSEADQVLVTQLEWIKERMLGGWSPITVFEERPKECVAVSRSSFYRFLVQHGLYKIVRYRKGLQGIDSLIAPINHDPGEALILDWGKLRDVIDPETGKKRVLWAFVGVLGFSRYMMIRLVWSNDIPTTLDAIESMLQEIGGVPKRVTSDNPKCFAIEAHKHDPLLNPAFERMAAHYGFRIECLPPADPEKKGKVERLMPFARRLFEAYPAIFGGLENAQGYMSRKCGIANERRHGTTTLRPIEVFVAKEASTLKALPALGYEKEEIAYPTVRRDGFVRFSNKYYAVSDGLIGRDAVVLATRTRVSIFAGGALAETYDRITNEYQTHAIAPHLQKPWQKIEENNAHTLKLADAIGVHCGELVRAVLMRGDGFVDTRIIWGVLCLDKKGYPHQAIDEACRAALELGKLSSRFVERLIRISQFAAPANKTSVQSAPITPAAPAQSIFKFARPMSVYKTRVAEAGNPAVPRNNVVPITNQQQTQE